MSTIEQLERRLAQLEARLQQQTESVVEWTTVARTNAAGDSDAANFAGNPSDRQRPIRRAAPWGISGRPVVGVLTAIVKAAAGVFNGINVGIATDKYGPQDLDEGETAIWNVAKALIRLWKTGKLTIDSDTDQAQDVVVNGGTAEVARVGDNLTAGAGFATWAHAVEFALNALGSAVPGPSNFDTVVKPNGALGTINSGAAHFKG